MDAQRAALLSKFRDSTRARLHRLGVTWSEIIDGGRREPEQTAAIMREIHTVKGESKLMGYATMNRVAHHVEELLTALRDAGFTGSDAEKDAVLTGVDVLAELVDDEAEPSGARAHRAARFLHEADDLAAVDGSISPGPSEKASKGVGHGDDLFRVEGAALHDLTDRAAALLRRRDLADRIVADIARIASDLSDETARARGAAPRREKLAALVKELTATIGHAQDEGFEDRLEITEMQESVRRIRMVRVQALFERQPATARQLARELHKKVKVVVDDGDVSIDKQIADRLQEPLLHLLRNAVDHGIESPQERLAAGKIEIATISLRARTVGGRVEIVVADDGRGVDVAAVKTIAIERGVIDSATAARLDDAGARELLFAAGFSTRKVATDMSGRGVGLDIVKVIIGELGGTARIESERGSGMRIILSVPVSLALVRALVFSSESGLFAVPSTSVRVIHRLDDLEVVTAADGEHAIIDGTRAPVIGLNDVLGIGAAEAVQDNVLLLDDGSERIALRVGRIIGEMQLVKQPLGAFLAASSLVSGAAILDGGRHCFFLQTGALARLRGAAARPYGGAAQARSRPRVLVVDDSEITRDMLVVLLQRRGFETSEAVDGKDALERMPTARPDIVLTDLDMPVMDGVELIRALRSNATTSGMPIVVLSTRGSASDKERAMHAGASGYVVKSGFKETDLVETLQLFLGERV